MDESDETDDMRQLSSELAIPTIWNVERLVFEILKLDKTKGMHAAHEVIFKHHPIDVINKILSVLSRFVSEQTPFQLNLAII